LDVILSIEILIDQKKVGSANFAGDIVGGENWGIGIAVFSGDQDDGTGISHFSDGLDCR